MSASKARRIKLYCPPVKKMIEMVAWEEQRLDLGSIALAFGLDPSTLKLNGHFISRGLDLISSSVTWKSLLSFFSAKRLSTGRDDHDALIVDGKLSRVGTKRAHDPKDAVNGILDSASVPREMGNSGAPATEDTNLVKSKKIREGNSGKNGDCGMSLLYNGIRLKRKQLLEDLSLLKKLRINETCSADITGKGNDLSRSISSSTCNLRCSPMSQNMKRTREDDVDDAILAAPYKKIR
ncbi:hypothetical protein L484_007036 [Morus notabilis]|uniref:Uncharacterized protein n=1 Tax=Morus notabilis TaxID=981085 RepID=W9RYP4_9ROSA|nr:uncharacterized protein LOC21390449 [Morus notabilis]EXB99128.1 hypothetical protein L484_007036 [Morus notabilis]